MFFYEYGELVLWAMDELQNGNRTKASKIRRIAEKLKERHNRYMRGEK